MASRKQALRRIDLDELLKDGKVVLLAGHHEGPAGRQAAVIGFVEGGPKDDPFYAVPTGLFRKRGDGRWTPDYQTIPDEVNNQLTVTDAATRIVAAPTPCRYLFVIPAAGSTTNFFYRIRGGADISTSNGTPIPTGGLVIPIDNVNKVYFIGSGASQTLGYAYAPDPEERTPQVGTTQGS